jgi:hypothetical protein
VRSEKVKKNTTLIDKRLTDQYEHTLYRRAAKIHNSHPDQKYLSIEVAARIMAYLKNLFYPTPPGSSPRTPLGTVKYKKKNKQSFIN